MKKATFLLANVAILLCFVGCSAGVKNAKMVSVKIFGNCEMCKERIEKVANVSGESEAIWDKSTKMLSLSFDSTKTNSDAILKKIAESGHDNEKFSAEEKTYRELPECCQYKRKEAVTP